MVRLQQKLSDNTKPEIIPIYLQTLDLTEQVKTLEMQLYLLVKEREGDERVEKFLNEKV